MGAGMQNQRKRRGADDCGDEAPRGEMEGTLSGLSAPRFPIRPTLVRCISSRQPSWPIFVSDHHLAASAFTQCACHHACRYFDTDLLI